MKIKFLILLLLAQFAANAQFKLGTFSAGVELVIYYYVSGNYQDNTVRLGASGDVFLSKKSALGFKISKSASASSSKYFSSENVYYNFNYQYYFPINSKIGFYNQTDFDFSMFIPFKNSYTELAYNHKNLSNSFGFYGILNKGLALKVKYVLGGFSYSENKEDYTYRKSEYTSKGFYLNLNPLNNIGTLQVAFVYYFNMKNDEK